MPGIPSISGQTSQNASSGARGGAFDAQSGYTFGGINNAGPGGSATSLSTYASMGVVAAVVVGLFYLLVLKR